VIPLAAPGGGWFRCACLNILAHNREQSAIIGK